jgi:hypothetical protein
VEIIIKADLAVAERVVRADRQKARQKNRERKIIQNQNLNAQVTREEKKVLVEGHQKVPKGEDPNHRSKDYIEALSTESAFYFIPLISIKFSKLAFV